MWTVKFSLEAALQTNDVIKSDMKEVNKQQFDNAPKRKDDEKTQMMQIIGLIRRVFLYFCDTTDIDSTFSRIKLTLMLVEFKWEKVIILWLLLTPRAWRVVLVCSHSISVSVIINYTNMAATSHVKLGFLKSKVNFCWIWTLPWRKN